MVAGFRKEGGRGGVVYHCCVGLAACCFLGMIDMCIDGRFCHDSGIRNLCLLGSVSVEASVYTMYVRLPGHRVIDQGKYMCL